jgi:hypothetical protein
LHIAPGRLIEHLSNVIRLTPTFVLTHAHELLAHSLDSQCLARATVYYKCARRHQVPPTAVVTNGAFVCLYVTDTCPPVKQSRHTRYLPQQSSPTVDDYETSGYADVPGARDDDINDGYLETEGADPNAYTYTTTTGDVTNGGANEEGGAEDLDGFGDTVEFD